MIVHSLVRLIFRVVTARLKVYNPGEAPVQMPERFATLTLPLAERTAKEIATAYCQVFGEAPWHERHSLLSVGEKLKRELSAPYSRLVVMRGDDKTPIGGFCWGSVVSPEEIPKRVVQARFPENPEGQRKAKKLLPFLGEEPILYLDELAVLRQFRGGLAPIVFLCRPLFELGWEAGTKGALFWTSEASKIKPLTTFAGFQPLGVIDKTIFMLNPDFTPLLKALQSLDPEGVQKIIAVTSRFFKREVSKPRE